MKIALTINAAQATATIPEAIDYQIDHLSNQPSLNIGLADTKSLSTGFLQSSDAKIRENSFALLSQNEKFFDHIKDCFKFMKKIETWNDLLTLNQIRFKFYQKARHYGLQNQHVIAAVKCVADAGKKIPSGKN